MMDNQTTEFHYEVTPQPQNHVTQVLAGCGFAAALIAFAASRWMSAFRLIPQCVAMIALVAGVYGIARSQVRFQYLLSLTLSEEGTPVPQELTVTLLRGRRRTVVCRMDMPTLLCYAEIRPENRKQILERFHRQMIYPYYPELAPAHSIILQFREPNGDVTMRLAWDDTLWDYLRRTGAENVGAASSQPPSPSR